MSNEKAYAQSEEENLWQTYLAPPSGGDAGTLTFAPHSATQPVLQVHELLRKELVPSSPEGQHMVHVGTSREKAKDNFQRLASIVMTGVTTYIASQKGSESNYQATGSAPFGQSYEPLGDPSASNANIAPTYDELKTIEEASVSASPDETKRIVSTNAKRAYILANRTLVVSTILLVLVNGITTAGWGQTKLWWFCDEGVRAKFVAAIKTIDASYGQNPEFNKNLGQENGLNLFLILPLVLKFHKHTVKTLTYFGFFATACRKLKEPICQWLQNLVFLITDVAKQYVPANADQQAAITKVLSDNPIVAYLLFETFMNGLGRSERTIPLISETSDKFYDKREGIINWSSLMEFKKTLDLSARTYETEQWLPHQSEIEAMAASACRPPDIARAPKATKATPHTSKPSFPKSNSSAASGGKTTKTQLKPALPPNPGENAFHPVFTKYTVKQVKEARSNFNEIAKQYAIEGKPAGFNSQPCIVCVTLNEEPTDHNTLDCIVLKPKENQTPKVGSKHPRDQQGFRGGRGGKSRGRGRGRGGFQKNP